MKQYRFRRWLRNWLTNFDGNQLVQEKVGRGISIRENDGPDNEKALHFRMWFVHGGKVIQTTRYDRVKDRNFTSMYIVTEEQDFGRELDKIITMESMRG